MQPLDITSRNEIYTIDNVIYKYTNEPGHEADILAHMNLNDPALPVPQLIGIEENVTSPSGKSFTSLLKMSRLPGQHQPLVNGRFVHSRTVTQKVAAVIERIHALGIVHLDLGYHNVLVDGDKVSILDFGNSRFCEPHKDETLTEISDYFGLLAMVHSPLLQGKEWKKKSLAEIIEAI
jgi:tRNA A-37 threonylcarbamoyl transferase component Bud32